MLLGIKQALLLKDEQEIYAQVDIRNKLISEMVGRLYPTILESEIKQLFKRLHWLRHDIGDFQI